MSLSDALELISTAGWRLFETVEKGRFLNTVDVPTVPSCGDGQQSPYLSGGYGSEALTLTTDCAFKHR
jgi:hypothetical protein